MCCKNKQNNGDLRRSSSERNYTRPVNLCLKKRGKIPNKFLYVYGGSRNSKQRKRTNLLALRRFSAGFLYTTVYTNHFFPPLACIAHIKSIQPFLSSNGNFVKLATLSAFLQTVTSPAISTLRNPVEILMNHAYSIAALYYNFDRNAFAL